MVTIKATDRNGNVSYISGTLGGDWQMALANGIPTSLPPKEPVGRMPDQMATQIALRKCATAQACLDALRSITHNSWQYEMVDEGVDPAAASIARLEADNAELLAALKGIIRECSLIHRHWGENCNASAARQAEEAAKAAIARAETDAPAPIPDAADALRRLLASPDLNLDSLEPETVAAIEQARAVVEGRTNG